MLRVDIFLKELATLIDRATPSTARTATSASPFPREMYETAGGVSSVCQELTRTLNCKDR